VLAVCGGCPGIAARNGHQNCCDYQHEQTSSTSELREFILGL
jgi:hypothetical protein